MASKNNPVSESEFYMWRALFAFVLKDKFLSLKDQEVFKKYILNVPFSALQREVLRRDFLAPQNVEILYSKITNHYYKQRFCELARILAWSDGNMDKQDEIILRNLSCLKKGEGADHLRKSRDADLVVNYHKEYRKAGGITSYLETHRIVEIRI